MPSAPWWQKGVIYQIAVSSFADSNGDGGGDLRGIIDRLDYLNDGTASSLGVDIIWLTPITTSPMRDFGYDVTDYRTVNPLLGSMEDFEELVEACHARGIKLVMDLVLNHTSDEHPWFVESRASRVNAKRDWYVWRDGRAPGLPPNRWRAAVEGSAWTYDRATKQYYYHGFLPFQPDLNWRNPDVKAEMFDIAHYWLDKGVDGFRLDLINFLYEDALLRDNPYKFGFRPYRAQVHLFDFSQPESLEAVKELRRMSDGYENRVLMGEVFTDTAVDCVDYLGDGTDALHLSFYLDLVLRKWGAEEYRESVGWLEEHLPPGGWACYYLNNHDLKRTYQSLGGRRDAEAKARVTAALLFTLRGTPIVYYGEEIGMRTSTLPRRLIHDPIGHKFWPAHRGRDGSRTPMQWSGGRNAGFTSGEPWLPVDSSYMHRNVERESCDPDSLLNWYRRLIRLRSDSPALLAGDYRALEGVPRGVFAYVREAGKDKMAVFLSFTRHTVALSGLGETLADTGWRIVLSSRGGDGERADPSSLELEPYGVVVAEATDST